MDWFSSRLRHRTAGLVAPTLIFVLSTIGITATATVAIFEAYLKYIEKPIEQSETKKLSAENDQLRAETKQLQERLDQEEILEAAQTVQLKTLRESGTQEKLASREKPLSDNLRYRFLSPEVIRLMRLSEAVELLQRTLKQNPATLSDLFGAGKIESWRHDLPERVNKINTLLEEYANEHPDPSRALIKTRIESARAVEEEAEK
jgi:cell division protein FtsB